MSKKFGIEVINPENPSGPKVKVWFSSSFYGGMYKYERTNYSNLRTAKFTLENPLAIFGGVRDYDESGWCYVSKPSTWYVKPEVRVPFREDLVYLVFVAKTGYVYNFRPEKQDSRNIDFPDGWETRFEGLIWPTTS